MNCIDEYDSVCLQDSKLDQCNYVRLPGFIALRQDRKHFKNRSGGIIILMKENWEKCLSVIKGESEHVTWLVIEKRST